RTARAHDVEDGVDDLPQRPAPWTAPRFRLRQERFDHPPFLIGDIALVTQSGSTILLASGCGPHDGSKCESATTWNHVGFSRSTYFETASQFYCVTNFAGGFFVGNTDI